MEKKRQEQIRSNNTQINHATFYEKQSIIFPSYRSLILKILNEISHEVEGYDLKKDFIKSILRIFPIFLK